MREVATVLVDKLNVHSAPGGTPETVIGEVKRGDKLEVLERRKGFKARWLRIGKDRWIAEVNTVTNERFARVDHLPDRPLPPPPVIVQDSTPPVWPWIVGIAIAVVMGGIWLFFP